MTGPPVGAGSVLVRRLVDRGPAFRACLCSERPFGDLAAGRFGFHDGVSERPIDRVGGRTARSTVAPTSSPHSPPRLGTGSTLRATTGSPSSAGVIRRSASNWVAVSRNRATGRAWNPASGTTVTVRSMGIVGASRMVTYRGVTPISGAADQFEPVDAGSVRPATEQGPVRNPARYRRLLPGDSVAGGEIETAAWTVPTSDPARTLLTPHRRSGGRTAVGTRSSGTGPRRGWVAARSPGRPSAG